MNTFFKIILIGFLNFGLMGGIISAANAIELTILSNVINDIKAGKDLKDNCKRLILNDSVLLRTDYSTNKAKAICHSELTY